MHVSSKNFLCTVLILVTSACNGEDPIVGVSAESDNKLLDSYQSIWQATAMYPEGNMYSLYNKQLEGCMGVNLLSISQRYGMSTAMQYLRGVKLTQCSEATLASRFFFLPATQGLVNICASLSGIHCLNNGLRDGSYVFLGQWYTSPSHQYRFATVNGTVQFVNQGSNTCLTAGYSYMKATQCDPKNPLQQWQICAPFHIQNRCWPKDAKEPVLILPANVH